MWGRMEGEGGIWLRLVQLDARALALSAAGQSCMGCRHDEHDAQQTCASLDSEAAGREMEKGESGVGENDSVRE